MHIVLYVTLILGSTKEGKESLINLVEENNRKVDYGRSGAFDHQRDNILNV